MELKWLEDFVSVARTGSFSSAARERYVTQPAFSRRVRALEHWLGVQLFDRTTFPIELTRYGLEFMPHALRIIETATHAQQDFRALSAQDDMLVRLSTLHSLSMYTVPKIIGPFVASNPRASVEIFSSIQGVEAHYDAIDGGDSHILFIYSNSWNDRRRRFLTKVIGREFLIPVVSRDFVEKHGMPIFGSATKVPVILYTPFTFSHALTASIIDPLAAQMRPRATSSLSETQKAMALEGIGLAWLPSNSVSHELASGRLIKVQSKDHQLEVQVDILAIRQIELKHRMAEKLWNALPDPHASLA